MPVLDVNTKTIRCDNQPDCNKSVTFNVAEGKQVSESPENTWMKSIRLIQTPDGRVLVYCSDVCEITGARTGQHNIPVPKKIIEVGNSAAVAAAAHAAEAAKVSDVNLKSGAGGPIVLG
jgi:hypothetical protein